MIRIFDIAANGARRRRRLATLVGGLVAFGAAAAVHAGTSPDFSLSAQPPSETVASGASTTYTVVVAPLGGFSSPVTLTAGALPKGTSASWTVGAITTSGATVTVPVGAGTRTATLTIGGGQPTAGTYSPTVTATSGSLTHSTTLTLVVVNQNSANFTLSVSPSVQTVAQGTVGSTVSIARTNWAGTVTVSVSGLPANTTATVTPGSTTGNSANLSIATTPSTPSGLYSVDVVGTAILSGKTTSTRYAAFTLNVLPPFSIAGNLSSSLALGIGNTQPLDLSITNPYSTSLTVSSLEVTLASVQSAVGAHGSCNQSGVNSPNFQITNLPSNYSVTVPANSTVKLSQVGSGQRPSVTWVDQNWSQNGCLGARLNFSYTGNGAF